MSKIIKLTAEHIESCIKEFREKLTSGKFADGKINFSKTFDETSRKAKLCFTELAWLKMQTLIREFDKEVAWHGVAKRGEDNTKDEYFITDILVYPQEVSGTTVEMDVEGYDEWIRSNFDDERFSHIAMQGHSHVRMPTNPSSVDLGHQEEILSQLTDDMFYIFVIWNKSGNRNIKIYDLQKNVLFETADVTVEIIPGDFIEDAKKMVREKTYSSVSARSAAVSKSNDKKEEYKYSGRNGKKKKGKNKENISGYTCNDWTNSYPYNDPFYYSGY